MPIKLVSRWLKLTSASEIWVAEIYLCFLLSYYYYLVSAKFWWLQLASASYYLLSRERGIWIFEIYQCFLPLSITFFIVVYVLFLKQDINILLVLNLLVLFCFQQLFAYSLGLLFGVLNVFFRDIREFLTIFMNIWFWMTPIVWVPSIAPEWLQKIQENANIYLWFLSEYRGIFLEGNTSSIENFGPLFLIAFLVLSSSISLIKMLEREIRDAI